MATETNFILISLNNLDRAIQHMHKVFAPLSIEKEMINTKVSKEQPADQDIEDLWFIETERN